MTKKYIELENPDATPKTLEQLNAENIKTCEECTHNTSAMVNGEVAFVFCKYALTDKSCLNFSLWEAKEDE